MLKALYLREELGDQSGFKVVPVLRTKQTALLPFCVSTIGEYKCDSRFFVDRSGYDTCLLMYTLAGEGVIKYEGQEYSLPPGQAVIIDCKKHQYYATKGKNWHFLWLHIEGKCAWDYVNILNEKGTLPINLNNRISFQNYYDKLLSYTRQFDTTGELQMSLAVQKLLTNMIQLKNTEVFSKLYGNYQTEIENNINYIQEHFTENITIEQLARLCNLSKHYYIKVFRSYTGHTPYDYILGLRLQLSQRMLLENKIPISQVASQCGFSDSKNFIYNFKKRFDVTPLQFRKQN